MKIDEKLKLRDVAGEKIVMLHGNGAKLCVVTMNETSVFLWNSLKNVDFSVDDVVNLLNSKFKVDKQQAREDAVSWVNSLKDYGAVVG